MYFLNLERDPQLWERDTPTFGEVAQLLGGVTS